MAYLRVRRSIKVAPGFKINLNKRSVGMTVGVRGGHYSVNTSGRRTKTVGIPGTGVSLIDRTGGWRPRASSSRASSYSGRGGQAVTVSAIASHPKHHVRPLSSHHERAYAKALERLRKNDVAAALPLLDDAIASDTKHEAVTAHLIAGIAHYKASDLDATINHLEPVVSTHTNSGEDQLLERYELPPEYAHFDVPIGQLEAPAGVVGLGPIYLLASAYAAVGRTREAAGVMQKLVSDHEGDIAPFPLIILCELYRLLGDWDEIVQLVGHFNITNTDDATLVLRTYQATAMANEHLTDTALEVLKDCLRSSKRTPGLLHAARYIRAQIYRNTGKTALAKRELSRIYAGDPSYPEVEAQLAELA